MAFELSTDLIRQVKTVTRAEAGLSDYDPTGNLPPLPSLSEAVAGFDPSPPYLRCKNCKGRLLRGVQSLLCIYCGRPNDVHPDPISFKDTFAYRWLVESLHLDGSELVGLATEKSGLNRGQDAQKGEIPLSDFLNLKVLWPTEVEKKEIALNKKTEDRSLLNLIGVDLDNFSSGSQMLHGSDLTEEHSFTSNRVEAVEAQEASTHHNLSFFENVEPSKSAVHSSESKDGVETAAKEVATNDDFNFFENVQSSELAARTPKKHYTDGNSFSGWEATFQSAVPGDQLDSSKTFEPFVISAVSSGNQHDGGSKSSESFGASTVDLSSQLDSVFGYREEVKDGITQTGTAASPSAGDWNNDLWNNLNSEVLQQTDQSDSAFGIRDTAREQAQGFDWFEVDEWQSNNVNTTSNNAKPGSDDSLNGWNDFKSSTSVNVQPMVTSATASDFNLFSTENKLEEIDFGSFSQADPFPSSLSKENASVGINDIGLEGSSSDRLADAESGTGRGPGESLRDGNEVRTVGSEQREVERILSQMHDLSFMLENDLSLPPKSDNLHS